MINKKFVTYIGMLVLSVSLLTACKDKETGDTGNKQPTAAPTTASDESDPNAPIAQNPSDIKSWAAVYEKNKEVLSFNADGSVTYKDVRYDSYAIDDTYLTLKGDEELKMRYVMKHKKMLLYDKKDYKRQVIEGKYTDVPAGSIEGVWAFDEKYSYEFTEKGTFYEDQNFPGHYQVDESDHSIKLMYNDQFEDTYLYYSLDGDVLTIEYPWSMVPTESE